jgi:hypothetical protein
MSPERRSPEPDPDGSELYQFADEPPPLPPRPAVPEPEPPPPPADHLEGEIDLGDEAPRPRRKKKRRAEHAQKDVEEPEEPVEEPIEVPLKPPRDILEREELPPPRPWWVVPAILSVIGFALCLVPIIVYASKEGATTGLALVGLTVIAVVVQVVAVTAFLTAVGTLFGIDYGPAVEAVGKLAAVVLVVDGLTGVMLLLNPCALVTAAIIGAGVFQYLFRLSVFEMILSVAGMVGASWVLNAAVVAILASKA